MHTAWHAHGRRDTCGRHGTAYGRRDTCTGRHSPFTISLAHAARTCSPSSILLKEKSYNRNKTTPTTGASTVLCPRSATCSPPVGFRLLLLFLVSSVRRQSAYSFASPTSASGARGEEEV